MKSWLSSKDARRTARVTGRFSRKSSSYPPVGRLGWKEIAVRWNIAGSELKSESGSALNSRGGRIVALAGADVGDAQANAAGISEPSSLLGVAFAGLLGLACRRRQVFDQDFYPSNPSLIERIFSWCDQ